MSQMNNINLSGRIARDFEVKTAGKTVVTTISLAVPYYDHQDKTEKADFIQVQLWGKDATTLEKYSGKGLRIAISGELKTSSYQKPDGTKVYNVFVQVNPMGRNLQLIDFKKENESTNSTSDEEQFNPPSTPNFGDDEDFTPVDDGDMPF